MKHLARAFFSASLLVPVLPGFVPSAQAQAVVYCCNGANGQKVCGDFLPDACRNRAYEERNGKGFVIREIAAPLTPAQIAARDAEAERKVALKKKQLEELRRNQALLSTYANEADIERAKERALADVDKSITQLEKALADAKKRRQGFEKEKDFYKNKPLPTQLKQQLAAADKDVQAKSEAVLARNKERGRVAGTFDAERQRFRELKKIKDEPVVEKPKREIIVQPAEPAATEAPATPTEPAAAATGETSPAR